MAAVVGATNSALAWNSPRGDADQTAERLLKDFDGEVTA
jgi:hypothetical protein